MRFFKTDIINLRFLKPIRFVTIANKENCKFWLKPDVFYDSKSGLKSTPIEFL